MASVPPVGGGSPPNSGKSEGAGDAHKKKHYSKEEIEKMSPEEIEKLGIVVNPDGSGDIPDENSNDV